MYTLEKEHTSHYRARVIQPSYVIIHTTEGRPGSSFLAAREYLKTNARKVSAHFLVGEGLVIQYADPFSEVTYHAGWDTSRLPDGTWGSRVNDATIGIEMFNTSGTPAGTPIVDTCIDLVRDLLKRSERLAPPRVLGHREVDPTRRRDPTGVNMDLFRSRVAQEGATVRVEKLRYHLEKAARDARSVGDQDVHDWLYKNIPAVLRLVSG